MELDKDALEKATGALVFNCPNCGDGSSGRCEACKEMVKRIVTAYEDTYHPLIKTLDELRKLPVRSAVRYGEESVYERNSDNPANKKQWMSQAGQVQVADADVPLPVRLMWTPTGL
ncbi:hypothetical protein ACTXJX_17385 [Glutamicibacter ardleyensis]|uniref:hypothetical protein n=1 Tax=Glutamicibacter ardleyensis TaxID=225894 RepID=UPI003FD316C9